MSRPTRKERQATTRIRLLEAAARVFCGRGIAHASVDEVAEDAGFTKGAFYANLKSKEELFLAMLDRSFAERLAEVDAAMATDAPIHAQARRAGEDFARAMAADPEWERLFFECAAHALRDEPFREELVTRYRSLREAIAAALSDTLPLPRERICGHGLRHVQRPGPRAPPRARCRARRRLSDDAPAGRNAAVDRAGMQAEGHELLPADHGVLLLRDGHDLPLDGSTSTIDVDPTFACHDCTLSSENACVARAL